jgi:plastocyanin
MRLRVIIAALAVAAASLSACGSDGGGHDHGATTPVAQGARRIAVTGHALRFDPATITVRAGEEVGIVLTSTDITHDFTIDDLVHVAAEPGTPRESGFTAPDEPGEYTFYCSVVGHRESGMVGTLVVT